MSDAGERTPERIWEVGFEGHERAQLRRMAAMTFRQKLEWLEEAHRLVLKLEAAREKPERPPGD
jgi:hypothetical protein